MACAHEAWLVSWMLPQHLTSAMALESVCRGQIFWPAGPTPGKSWGGWFILQNLGRALSRMTKTQLELVCFEGRAKISQFYLALIGTNGLEGLELIVYHPDQAICWEIPYTARVENTSLLTALFRPGCLLTWSKKCRVYLMGLDILHAHFIVMQEFSNMMSNQIISFAWFNTLVTCSYNDLSMSLVCSNLCVSPIDFLSSEMGGTQMQLLPGIFQ